MVAAAYVDPLDVACHTESMKSAEGFEIRPVHVLRHSFEASEPLRKTLAPLSIKESVKFRVFGTKQFSLEGFEYYGSKYDIVLTEAAREFHTQEAPLLLSGQLKTSHINENIVRVAFQASNQQYLNRLLGEAEGAVNQFAGSRVELRGVVAASAAENYLYYDVPAKDFTDDFETISRVKEEFSSNVSSDSIGRSHYVRPMDIVGIDTVARLARLRL